MGDVLKFANPTSLENLSERHKLALARVIEIYKQRWLDKLIAVYVFGSTVRGDAKPTSDLDTVAIVDDTDNYTREESKAWAEAKVAELKAEFPDIEQVDVVFRHLSDTVGNLHWQSMLQLDGQIAYGTDIFANHPLPADVKEVALAKYGRYFKVIPDTIARLEDDPARTPEVISWGSQYLAKTVLRLGVAVMMIQHLEYTDVPVDQALKLTAFYPEYKDLWDTALKFRHIGTEDDTELINFIEQVKLFLKFANQAIP